MPYFQHAANHLFLLGDSLKTLAIIVFMNQTKIKNHDLHFTHKSIMNGFLIVSRKSIQSFESDAFQISLIGIEISQFLERRKFLIPALIPLTPLTYRWLFERHPKLIWTVISRSHAQKLKHI